MTGGGFYEQRRFSPTGFGTVVALHAAAIVALVLIRGPEIIGRAPPMTGYNVLPASTQPEPEPEPVERVIPRPPQRSVIDRPEPLVPTPVQGNGASERAMEAIDLTRRIGEGDLPPLPPITPPPPPMRIDAQFDPRFAADMQPPYPASEQRAQRDGTVRLRVTIGADGRVKAVERLSATSDAFWQATERHAFARWRFRPATLDGQPVESTKVLNLFFRIEA